MTVVVTVLQKSFIDKSNILKVGTVWLADEGCNGTPHLRLALKGDLGNGDSKACGCYAVHVDRGVALSCVCAVHKGD